MRAELKNGATPMDGGAPQIHFEGCCESNTGDRVFAIWTGRGLASYLATVGLNDVSVHF